MPIFGPNIDRYETPIAEAARRYSVSPNLIAAVISQESRGNPWAVRWEEGFFRKYLRGRSFSDLPGFWPPSSRVPTETERTLRSHSWGLMQCMGQTARESGYAGDWLTELLIPEVNIDVCTKILAAKIHRNGGNIEAGLLSYNGGANPNYPKEVVAKMTKGSANA